MITLKKKIAVLAAALMLTVSVVNASENINGDYNGYPIVKITKGLFAKEEVVTDVPAILFEGQVMVPLSAIEQFGGFVHFDEEALTARISIPKNSENPNYDLLYLSNSLKENSVEYVEYLAQPEVFTRLNVKYTGSFQDENYIKKDFMDIMFWSTLTDARVLQIIDKDGSLIWAYSNFVYDYVSEKITYEEFKTNLHIAINRPTKALTPLPSLPSTPSSASVIETKIEGDFEGWEGETIFKLDNGQIWQQESYAYTYHYAYRPDVLIYKSGTRYKMKVEGVKDEIYVKRLK